MTSLLNGCLHNRSPTIRGLYWGPLIVGKISIEYISQVYEESQWLRIMGYFKPIMVYFGV